MSRANRRVKVAAQNVCDESKPALPNSRPEKIALARAKSAILRAGIAAIFEAKELQPFEASWFSLHAAERDRTLQTRWRTESHSNSQCGLRITSVRYFNRHFLGFCRCICIATVCIARRRFMTTVCSCNSFARSRQSASVTRSGASLGCYSRN